MGSVSRGLRNVYRSKGRVLLAVLIVGLSVGIFLSMLQAGSGIERQSVKLRREVETVIEVRPLDSPMALVTDSPVPIPRDAVNMIRAIPNVLNVEKYLRVRIDEKEKPPTINKIIVTGMEPGSSLRAATHGQFVVTTIDAGKDRFEPSDAGRNLAIVGRFFAQDHGLKVGSEFSIGDSFILRIGDKRIELKDLGEFEVVGIFSSDFVFGDLQIFIPYDTFQRTFGKVMELPSQSTNIFVTVNSVDNVAEVEGDIRAVLGGSADVLSGKTVANIAAQALNVIQASSILAAALSAVVGSLVITFTMILTVRQRTREIGVLKAIGASNSDVAKDFLVEALALGVISGLVGIAFLALAGPTFAYLLLNPIGSQLAGVAALGTGHENPTSALFSEVGFNPSLSLISYALGISVLFGLIGSLYSVTTAVRLRPAEAIRHE